MKNPLLIGIAWVTLIALTVTTIYAQVANTSIVDRMKAAVHAFTLSAELNSGQTGYESAPVSGKKTGNMLTAAEWNRMLEIISQGTVGGGGDKFTFLDTQILLYSSGVTTSDKNTPIALDISSIAGVTIPTNAKAVQLYVICSSFSSQNENVRLNLGRSPTTMLRVCQQNVSGATNSDDTNSTILPLADDKKTLYYSYNVPASGSGWQISIYLRGFITE